MADIYDRILDQAPSQNPRQPGVDIYDQLLNRRETDEKQMLITSLKAASQFDPNKAGEAQRLGAQIGVPSDVAERNLDEIRARVRQQVIENQKLMATSPVLARQLQDLEFAKIAQDQVENLSKTEKVFKWFSDIPKDISKGWEAGRLQSEQGFLGEKLMRGAATPDDMARIGGIESRLRELKGTGGFAEATTKVLGQMSYTLPDSIAYGQAGAMTAGSAAFIAGQLGPQAALPEEIFTVPTAAIGGFFAGSAAKMAEQSYRVEAGQAYLDMMRDGIDKNVARNVSAGVGLVNATLEVVGVGFITAPIKAALIKEVTKEFSQALTKPTTAMAVKEFAKNYGKAWTGEVTTELLQEVSAIAGDEIARSISKPELENKLSTEEGRKELAQRMMDVFDEVGKAMAVLALPGASFNFHSDYKRAQQAKRQSQFFSDLTQSATESEVRKRNPTAYENFIQAQAANTGAENVYVDAQQFVNVLRQTNLSSDQLAQSLPEIAAQVQEALQTGGDIIIPTQQYAARIAGTEFGDALMQHARIDPDAMSASEAVQFEQNKQQIMAQAGEIIEQQAEINEFFSTSAKEVETKMYDQLMATGQYQPKVARTNAEFVRDFVVTQSASLNMLPTEFYEKYMYRVEMAGQQNAQMFNQDGTLKTDTPNFRNWFKESMVVDAENKPLVMYHGTQRAPNGIESFDSTSGYAGQNTAGLSWFTSSSKAASGYANWVPESGNPTVYPVYLSIQNPASINDYYNVVSAINSGITSNYVSQDPEIGLYDKRVVDQLKAQGFDGIRWTEAEYTGSEGFDTDNDVTAIPFSDTQIKSVFNQGTFDPNNPNILKQSATLRSGKETFKKYGLNPNGKYKTRDIAAALEARQRDKYGKIAEDDRSPEALAKIAKWMQAEVEFEMQNPEKSGVGWYSEKFQRALDIMGDYFPELKTDKTARDTMTALIAITSDGQKVVPNFAQAMDYYESFRQTGVFKSTRGHARQASIDNNVAVLQRLHDMMGAQAMHEYLMQEKTISELKQIAKENGGEMKSDYQAHIKMPMAAVEFGPKLGAFYANLMGAHGYLTMDRWWSRTFNRYRGTLLTAPTQQGLGRFKQLFGKPEMSNDEAIAATVEYRNAYEAKGFKNGTEIEKAANTIYKAAFDALEDAPFNATDRTFMLNAVNKAQKALAKKGYQLSIADIQAILWYYEKRLYGELGARQSADISYEEAARRVVAGYANRSGNLAFQDEQAQPSEDGGPTQAGVPVGEDVYQPGSQVLSQSSVPTVNENNEYTADLFGKKIPAAQGADSDAGGSAGGRLARIVQKDDTRGTYATRTELVSEIKRELGTTQVKSAADAAQAFAFLSRKAVERFDALVTDRNGKPLAIVGSFKGDTSSTAIYVSTILREAIRIKGAANIWVAHNHPSGNPNLSDADRKVQQRMESVFRGSKIKVRGLLAIGGGTTDERPWSYTDGGKKDETGVTSKPTGTAKVPIVERDLVASETLGPRIIRPEDAIQAARNISGGESGALLLNHSYEPVGFIPIDPVGSEQLRDTGRMDTLLRAVSISNSSAVILVNHNDTYNHTQANNLAGFFNSNDTNVLDMISFVPGYPPHSNAWVTKSTTFAQSSNESARGGFDPSRLTTILNEKTDLSTFLHETAHFFLTVYADMAAQPNATPQMKADMQIILDWFKVPDLATWNSMTLEQQRKYHEQFAYSYELYLFEGKAPSVQLQSIFERFSAWLRRVYQSIREDLNAIYRQEHGEDLPILTGEVRQVMDRMLASEEQIKQAESVRSMVPMFQTQEQSGMDDVTWAAYQVMLQEARDAAVTDLTKASMRQMKWLSNAGGRVLKELQKQTETTRKQVRDEVTAEVEAQPVYRAIRFLKRGELVNDDGTVTTQDGSHKLSIDGLESMYMGEGDRYALFDWSRLSPGMTSKDGLHPDVVAEMFGFASGDQMVREILAAPPMKDAIDQKTDNRMLAEHAEMTDQKSIELAVEQALHNEARSRFVAVELRYLSKATQPVRVMLQAAKQAARELISKKAIKDIKPREFSVAEGRASKASLEAIKKGDSSAAAQAKQNQLLQNQLAAEAVAARNEVEKALEGFKKFFRADDRIAANRNMDLVDAARSILAYYGLGKKGKSPVEYIEKLRAYNPDLYAEIEPLIIKAAEGSTMYNELTMDEFRAMRDTVEALWFQSKRENEVMVEGRAVALKEITDELNARLDEIGIPAEVAGERQAPGAKDRAVRSFYNAKAITRRVEHWADATDGPAGVGPFTKYIWRPIRAALDEYRQVRNQYVKRYVEMIEKLDLPVAKIEAPELQYTFGNENGGIGKAELLGALLHTGNASNLKKLLLGRGWGSLREDGTLDASAWQSFIARMITEGKLTKADFDFAQAVWDLNEELKPMAQEAHHDLFGYYFKEVEASPVVTTFGVYRGGYVPAKTDTFLVRDAQRNAKMEELESDFRNSMPSTGMGFTKARVEYNKPLSLDIRLMAKHIDDVIRFAKVQPAVKDTLRILRRREFADNLTRIDPTAIEDMLVPWLNRAARQITSEAGMHTGVDQFWRAVRSRTGVAIMFANITNALQQVTGYFPALLKVKPTYLKSAMVSYISNTQKVTEDVAALSPFMADRLKNQVFDMQETMNDLLLNPSRYEKIQKWSAHHGYFLQQAFQNQVDVVTWTGTFNQTLAELGADKTDEQAVREATYRADAAVRMTQSSLLPEDMAAFEVGSPFYKTLIQFAGYFNMMANLNANEYVKVFRDLGWRGNKGKLFMIYLLGFGLPMLMSDAIVRSLGGQWDDDDDDGYLDEVMEWFFGSQIRGAVAMVPAFGPGVAAIGNAFNNKPYDDRMTTSPSVSALEGSTVGVVKAGINIVSEDREVTGKNIRDILTALSLITGVPLTVLGRPIGYAWDAERGKINPESEADYVRGLVTGKASEASKP